MNQDNVKDPRFHGDVTLETSKNMSKVRGKDTAMEIKLRKALWAKGYRYRKNYNKLPGRSDIVMTKHRMLIQSQGHKKYVKKGEQAPL